MRTTVTIDEHLLAEAKILAARGHRTIGSVLEDALRLLLAEHSRRAEVAGDFSLPTFEPDDPGVRRGVDLLDREALAEALGDNTTASRS